MKLPKKRFCNDCVHHSKEDESLICKRCDKDYSMYDKMEYEVKFEKNEDCDSEEASIDFGNDHVVAQLRPILDMWLNDPYSKSLAHMSPELKESWEAISDLVDKKDKQKQGRAERIALPKPGDKVILICIDNQGVESNFTKGLDYVGYYTEDVKYFKVENDNGLDSMMSTARFKIKPEQKEKPNAKAKS